MAEGKVDGSGAAMEAALQCAAERALALAVGE